MRNALLRSATIVIGRYDISRLFQPSTYNGSNRGAAEEHSGLIYLFIIIISSIIIKLICKAQNQNKYSKCAKSR